MTFIDAALAELKKTVEKSRVKGKKSYTETVNHCASHLVLLNQSKITPKSSIKLADSFRKSFIPVYAGFPLPSLQLVAALFHTIYHEKVLPALGEQLQEQKMLWEEVLNSLLSGVLDFLEEAENDEVRSITAKDAIATALYPILCDLCFSLTAPMMSVNLRCTAYTLLSDSAVSHGGNQKKLRNDDILGGERIGRVIWRTRDYLALESLLTLFARLLPSIRDASSGRTKRTMFIQSVFVASQSPEVGSLGKTVADILENVSSADWDVTSRKIVDTLSKGSLAFPQPFTVDEVSACGQIKQSDRLFVDDKALVANVLHGDDQYDTLNIPYPTVHKFEITRDRHDDAKEGAQQKRLKEIVPPKLSLADSSTILEFDSQGNPLQELSQHERIENVAKLYQTNQSSDDLRVSEHLEAHGASVRSVVLLSTGEDVSVPPASAVSNPVIKVISELPEDRSIQISKTEAPPRQPSPLPAHASSKSLSVSSAVSAAQTGPFSASLKLASKKTNAALSRTKSQRIREQVFGASGEELSEISDMEPSPTPIRSASSKTKPITLTRATTKESSFSIPSGTRPVVTKRILDSDDEATSVIEAGKDILSKLGRTKKKAVLCGGVISEDEIESGPSTQPAFVTPPPVRERLNLVPVTPSKPSTRASLKRNVSASINTREASTAPLESSVVSKAERKKTATSANLKLVLGQADNRLTVCVKSSDLKVASATAGSTESVHLAVHNLAKVENVTNDRSEEVVDDAVDFKLGSFPAVNVVDSSPVPVVATGPKSVKAGLRKKDQAISKTVQDPSHVSASKRKRAPADDEATAPDQQAQPSSAKRPHTVEGASETSSKAIPSELTKLQVLRPRRAAAARAMKKYRGKKDRTSSPAPMVEDVDYDALPGEVAADPLPTSSDALIASPHNRKKPVLRSKKVAPSSVVKAENRVSHNEVKDDNQLIAHSALVGDDALQDSSGECKNGIFIPPTSAQGEKAISISHRASRTRTAVNKEIAVAPPKQIEPRIESGYSKVSAALATNTEYVSKAHTIVQKPQANSRRGVMSVKPATNTISEPQLVNNCSPVTKNTLHDIAGDLDDIVKELPPPVDSSEREQPDNTFPENVFVENLTTVYAEDWQELATQEQEPIARLLQNRPVVSKPPTKFNVPRPKIPVTIDLTFDESPNKRSPPTRCDSPTHDVIEIAALNPSQYSQSTPRREIIAPDSSLTSSIKTARQKHTVTFAKTVQERSPSPPSPYLPFSKWILDDEPEKVTRISRSPLKGPRMDTKRRVLRKEVGHERKPKNGITGKKGDMDSIVQVLDELNQAILDKITRKFQGVREDVRIGRDALLNEAAEDLQRLFAESAKHFNGLIDLEAEYATFGRTVMAGFEDLLALDRDICEHLTKKIEVHDRSSLSKKFPPTLLPLPASILSSRSK
ncbi:uncharacterized protein FIBRA_00012 [Fibroporia radiculosa]|uniref:Uncharacterized protein n=1 Tax=Fibroporia radiculosa TaxID=599839 RepID=J7S5H5_9APHY|nr:uncharacterized protein FIBRA_00012 [Fibroporia radiculosa]CCL98019.1 predicted protein [Fibroporia radiculosa]